MPQVEVKNIQGKVVSNIDLNESVFGIDPNYDLIHRYIVMQMNSKRQGSASTKTRAEVSGGGRKPWRQKGTGRARFGSSRNGLWRHGGVIHGPKPKDWATKLNKKMKAKALLSAISLRVKEGNLVVLDDISFENPRTKEMKKVLDNLGLENKKCLFVLPFKNDKYDTVKLSGKNLPNVKVIIADNPGNEKNGNKINIDGLNVYDLINNEIIVFTSDMVKKVEEVFNK
jgi:large subunit ribosomal protein L4